MTDRPSVNDCGGMATAGYSLTLMTLFHLLHIGCNLSLLLSKLEIDLALIMNRGMVRTALIGGFRSEILPS